MLFVGQAPSKTSVEPLDGNSGRAIARLLGITHAEFLVRFNRINLNREYRGRSKAGRGDRFDRWEAKHAAVGVQAAEQARIVLLGRQVAESFGLGFDPLKIQRAKSGFGGSEIVSRYLIFPHPSGLNRWWNKPGNRRAARKRLRSFCR